MGKTTVSIPVQLSTGTGRFVDTTISAEVLNGALVFPGESWAVRNETGGTLAVNTLVYASGWSSAEGVPLVTKADADVADAQAMFVLPAAIPNNANGLAYKSFLSAANLATDGAGSAGDPVYLDATTAGGWTVTAPTAAGANVQKVGHVVVKHATLGQVAFNIGDIPSVATQDIQPKAVTAAKVALADGKVLIGGGTGVAAEQTLTGDVTVTNAGVTAIGAGRVTSAMLAEGAGVAALLTAGLGGSHSIIKSETATHTLVAAHATKDRACLVVVYVDENFATGDTSATVIEVGEDDTIDKCFDHTLLVNGVTAGTVYCRAFTNTATKKVIATSTAAAGTGTGGATITVLAIPTT